MDFFGLGMGEILLIIIVALILWEPSKIPELARKLGKAVTTLRQTSSDLTAQIRKELEAEETAERKHMPRPEVNTSPETPALSSGDTPERDNAEKTEPERR